MIQRRRLAAVKGVKLRRCPLKNASRLTVGVVFHAEAVLLRLLIEKFALLFYFGTYQVLRVFGGLHLKSPV